MAGSVNKVIIVGNLGRDPESKAFQNGGKVVNLRIATSESWKDKMSGERKEKTEWHSVAIFNEGLANVAEKYLRKGSKVYIEGALQTREVAGRAGPGQVFDRDRAAGLQQRPDDARRSERRRRRWCRRRRW